MHCGHALGFLPSPGKLAALAPAAEGAWRPLSPGQADQCYRLCANGGQHQVCNWLVPINELDEFCLSCRLNELIPNLSWSGNLERWHKIEQAKRRLLYTILRFALPLDGVPAENRPALRFRFIGDVEGSPTVLTGYLNGVLTLNIAEADDAERELRRVNLHEPYRTLLGHLRHEAAHYYWDRLIANSAWLPGFRQCFGDETLDYEGALKRYYAQGAPPDWQARHVSAYAGAHPAEDWAETWAHYFHITDMVETAGSFGLILRPNHPAAGAMSADPGHISETNVSFDTILQHWFPLAQALNSLNRGMGLPDAYPFVLSRLAIERLEFVHEVMQSFQASNKSWRND